MVGGDRDEHGCIGSAGYDWFILKQQCLRPFEVDFDLSFTITHSTYWTFGGIMFDETKKKAEVMFSYDESYHEIMIADADGTKWESPSCVLNLLNGTYTLSFKNGELIAKGMQLHGRQ